MQKGTCNIHAQTFCSHVNKTVIRATYIISLLVHFRIRMHTITIKVQVEPIIMKEYRCCICYIVGIVLRFTLMINENVREEKNGPKFFL